jgi:hypothetical protein
MCTHNKLESGSFNGFQLDDFVTFVAGLLCSFVGRRQVLRVKERHACSTRTNLPFLSISACDFPRPRSMH